VFGNSSARLNERIWSQVALDVGSDDLSCDAVTNDEPLVCSRHDGLVVREDGDEREDDTDDSVEIVLSSKENKEGHRGQRLSARMAMTEFLLFRGMRCPGAYSRRRKDQRAGVRANIPTQANGPVIEVGMDGGVMRGCGNPFWETVEQGGLQRLQRLVGRECSSRNQNRGLAGYKTARRCSLLAQITRRIAHDREKLL